MVQYWELLAHRAPDSQYDLGTSVMESIATHPQTPTKPTRSLLGLALAFCLSLAVGLAMWIFLARLNEYQPLYHLRLPIHQSHFELLMAGPWLVTVASADPNVGLCDFEYRHLETGELAYQLRDQHHLIHPRPMIYLPARNGDQNEGLITHQLTDTEASITLIQPQFRSKKTLLEYRVSRFFASSSYSAEFYCTFNYLDLEPFLILANSGLPGGIATRFQHYLADDDRSLMGAFLIKVYATRTGKCISTCSLPTRWDCYCFPTFLDDGEHLLVHFVHDSLQLRQYLSKYCTAPEHKAAAAANMPGLMLFNYRTGKVVKEWSDIKAAVLTEMNQNSFLINTTSIEPIEVWNALTPNKVRRHLLFDTNTFQTIPLPSDLPCSFVYLAQAQSGYQFLQIENLPSDPASAQFTWQLLNGSGQVEQTTNWTGERQPTVYLIPKQQQILLVESSAGRLHELWSQWSKRIPLLKKLPWEPKQTACLFDIATQERLLPARHDSVISYRASEDGKRLLIATRTEGSPAMCDIKVYALPIVPHAWWIHWLPRMAGCLAAFLVWRLVRGRQVRLS